MKIIELVILTLIGTSCAHFTGAESSYDATKYQITQKQNDNTGYTSGKGHIKIGYEDFEESKKDLENRIQNEMTKEEDAKKLRDSLPKSGYITINIFRPTIESGNTKSFSYVLTKNGKEIKRQEGGTQFPGGKTVPNTPSYSGLDGNLWTNTDMIEIETTFDKNDVITLYVIDKILGGRDVFEIKKLK